MKINKISYKGIRGLWSSSSDNTISFNKSVLENGYSNEEAAFETWTGQRALEQDFNKMKVDKLIPEKPPYTSITVTFYNKKMDLIKIETVKGKKLINKRNLAEIFNNFSHEEKEYSIIKSLFVEVTSEDDLIIKLKKLKTNLHQLRYYYS